MTNVPIQSLIDHIKTAVDVDPWAKEMAEELLKEQPKWISVKDQLPEDNVTVLAVKQLKNGRREMCLAYCIRNYERFNPETFRNEPGGPYWVCGGNNNILYWMPLPEPPQC